MSDFIPEKMHLREVLLFLFNINLIFNGLEDLRTTISTWKIRNAKDHQKWFEYEDLDEILDKDPCLSETQLVEALNVTHQCISKRLHRIGMVQKKGN